MSHTIGKRRGKAFEVTCEAPGGKQWTVTGYGNNESTVKRNVERTLAPGRKVVGIRELDGRDRLDELVMQVKKDLKRKGLLH